MEHATPPRVSNSEIADALERVADLVEAQDGDPFRVRAYRKGAETLRRLDQPVVEILAAEGTAGLVKLPGIGKSIAALVDEYAHNLRLGLLDRLEGQTSPEDLFTTLPGVGDELAERIHHDLHVETLEDLEVAAHDGRLAAVPGIGPRRLRGIQDSLAALLAKSSRRRARRQRWLESGRSHPSDAAARPSAEADTRPPVALLLDVDVEYRRRAAAGELRKIAPRRFNPGGKAWLPVLHTDRDGWAFTALFSNTARAHELGRTDDWVVLYWEQDGHEDQCTVVTEHAGPQRGRRVVRGREGESAAPVEAAESD